MNSQKDKDTCYSWEGILDIKRNAEHETWSNVETTTLVEGRWVKPEGSLPAPEQHSVGEWWSKLRVKGQRRAVEQGERCRVFSIKSFMIKLHGGLWEIMRFESGAAFSKFWGCGSAGQLCCQRTLSFHGSQESDGYQPAFACKNNNEKCTIWNRTATR